MISGDRSILVLNGGSSSIKFALFAVDSSLRTKLSGQIERIGTPDAVFSTQGGDHEARATQRVEAADYAGAIRRLIDWIDQKDVDGTLIAVGHRIVHGGPNFHEPQRLTPTLLAELHQLTPLDRQHMPGEILLAAAFAKRFPQVPQMVCFDTAFHRYLPRAAQMLPIPRRYHAQGVRRYGFHGLSYEFLMTELTRIDGAAAASGRIILAHLGNGASLAAVADAMSIDTSMGFTPTAGVAMGTRSDMRDLLNIENEDKRAAEAVALFCYQIKKNIGAYSAALGGLDTLVFSGGIGEKSPVVRERICAGLGFLGIALDTQRNAQNAKLISVDDGRVKVRVIRTNEELVIARSVCRLLGISVA